MLVILRCLAAIGVLAWSVAHGISGRRADITNTASWSPEEKTTRPRSLWWAIGLLVLSAGLTYFAFTRYMDIERNKAWLRDYDYLYLRNEIEDFRGQMVISSIAAIGCLGSGLYLLKRQYFPDSFAGLKARPAPQPEAKHTTPPPPYPMVVYSLLIPANTPWKVEQALKLVEQLLFTFPKLVFSIHADHQKVTWQIIDPLLGLDPDWVEKTIRTLYPELEVEIALVDDPEAPQEGEEAFPPFYRYHAHYQQANLFIAPINHIGDLKDADPLGALAQALSDLQPGEQVSYWLGSEGIDQNAYKKADKLMTQSTIHPMQFLYQYGMSDALSKVAHGTTRTEKFVPQDQAMFEEKIRQKLYKVFLCVQIDCRDKGRIADLLLLVDTALSNFTRMPYNALQWVNQPIEQHTKAIYTPEEDTQSDLLKGYRRDYAANKPWRVPFLILEQREVAALWHLPHEGFRAPRIAWLPLGQVSLPVDLIDTRGETTIGDGKYRGTWHPVFLNPHDRRHHMALIGKTGMGKSTLLHHLIHQDIARGAGVAVIDPHGTLVEAVLWASIPPEREADVVLLDLANQDYPPPLNPMRYNQGSVAMGRVIDVIENLFEGTDQRVTVAKYLRAAAGLLQEDQRATMRDLAWVFTQAPYRHKLLDKTQNPFVLDVWDGYEQQTEAQQKRAYEPIFNRLSPFYGNPTLYPLLCHPDALPFKTYLQEQKIILISLAMEDDLVSEQERNLIGSLLVSLLQSAGMKAGLNNPFYLYIDEVQRFVTTSLPILLSEARKFGLSLTLANQFLDQLTGHTLEALLGNIGTSVLFRAGAEDARAMSLHMRPQFEAEALVNLNQFEAAVKLQQRGKTLPAFTLYTLPPLDIPTDADERATRIRQQSIQCYTPKSRGQVTAWLSERYPRLTHYTPADEEDTFYDPPLN